MIHVLWHCGQKLLLYYQQILMAVAPWQNSKAVDYHSCADNKKKWTNTLLYICIYIYIYIYDIWPLLFKCWNVQSSSDSGLLKFNYHSCADNKKKWTNTLYIYIYSHFYSNVEMFSAALIMGYWNSTTIRERMRNSFVRRAKKLLKPQIFQVLFICFICNSLTEKFSLLPLFTLY